MVYKTAVLALKPFRLLSMVMTYLLGGGLVQYARGMRSWSGFIQGIIFLILISLCIELLKLIQKFSSASNWPEGMKLKEAKRVRWSIAIITATFMTTATTVVVSWMMEGVMWQGITVLLVMEILVGIIYYISLTVDTLQPFQILVEVLLYVVIPPAFAFFLQSTDPHRLLTLIVICLIPAYFAYRLLTDLKSFGEDIKKERLTVVTQMGWEKAMVLHNASILLVYLLFALIASLGFPWFLLWPIFLTLPIGLLEIWLMERTRQGKKPLWRVMQLSSIAIYLFPIYLIGFAFWIR